MAAIGGLLSGVAAIIALFIAQPATLRLVLPESVLREASGENAQPALRTGEASTAPQQAAAQQAAASDTEQPAPPIEAEPPAPPTQTLGDGVTVSLINLADTPDRYVATIRFDNTSGADIGIAVERAGPFEGQMTLTDSAGGTCQFISNGEGWGTLDAEEAEEPRYAFGEPRFRTVQANGRAQHTMFFNKGRCATRITADAGLTISGSFVVNVNGRRRAAPIYFENLTLRRQ
ncbi:MAG: hypothetical protein AB7J28_11700 [Hyphomonadaceae bacterium]